MPTPGYILDLRRAYGQGLLLLPGVSAVVVRQEPGRRPEVLLGRRADNGRWELPAGIVEPGEHPATTCEREVAEETGAEVRVERLALLSVDAAVTYPNGDRVQFVSMTFRATYLGGAVGVGDEESTAVGWFDLDQLPDLDDRQLRRLAAGLSDEPACILDR